MSVETKMNQDTVIVGAGPAGLHAAKILAGNGKDVLILEKLPENRIGEKVCAGGLSPKIIDRVPKKLIERYIRSINVYSPSFEKWILEGEEPFIGMISRLELGQWQLDQALKAGAKLEDGEEVKSIDLNKKTVKTRKGKEFEYNKLIGCDGATSTVRKCLGLKKKTSFFFQWTVENTRHEDLEVYVDFSKFGLGTMYVFPHDDYVAIGGGGPFPKKPIKDFKEYTQKFFEKKGFNFENAVFGAALVSYGYKGHNFPKRNVTLLGDAGGLSEPMTGEGIAQAVLSSELEFDRGIEEGKRERIEDKLFRDKRIYLFTMIYPYLMYHKIRLDQWIGNFSIEKICSSEMAKTFLGDKGVKHWFKARF